MERKNKMIIITLFLIACIIIIASVIKVYRQHQDNLYNVIEKKITETAKDCFMDGICTGNETTLDFLIRNGYLANQIDPITKEDINGDLVILWDGKSCSTKLR